MSLLLRVKALAEAIAVDVKALEDGKVSKTNIVQGSGQSATAIMSQKAVTDLLEGGSGGSSGGGGGWPELERIGCIYEPGMSKGPEPGSMHLWVADAGDSIIIGGSYANHIPATTGHKVATLPEGFNYGGSGWIPAATSGNPSQGLQLRSDGGLYQVGGPGYLTSAFLATTTIPKGVSPVELPPIEWTSVLVVGTAGTRMGYNTTYGSLTPNTSVGLEPLSALVKFDWNKTGVPNVGITLNPNVTGRLYDITLELPSGERVMMNNSNLANANYNTRVGEALMQLPLGVPINLRFERIK